MSHRFHYTGLLSFFSPVRLRKTNIANVNPSTEMPDLNCTDAAWLVCALPLETISKTICGGNTICNNALTVLATVLSVLSFFGLILLSTILVSLCFRIWLTCQIYAVERLIVARQKLIARNIRAIQQLPIFPRQLCIVSEGEPGLSKGKIRGSANLLGIPFTISLITLITSWANNISVLQDPQLVILGLISPLVCAAGVWITLAIAHNSRAEHSEKSNAKANDPEKGNVTPLDESERLLDFAEINEMVFNKIILGR
ncbi:hypothetical protein F5Y18DRAFT_443252 [Xylariaceae sp. FL1019]|nr:hypothetical protein F5Y18DRAFT_443252 [Xylariaceae sp. FL1019]